MPPREARARGPSAGDRAGRLDPDLRLSVHARRSTRAAGKGPRLGYATAAPPTPATYATPHAARPAPGITEPAMSAPPAAPGPSEFTRILDASRMRELGLRGGQAAGLQRVLFRRRLPRNSPPSPLPAPVVPAAPQVRPAALSATGSTGAWNDVRTHRFRKRRECTFRRRRCLHRPLRRRQSPLSPRAVDCSSWCLSC